MDIIDMTALYSQLEGEIFKRDVEWCLADSQSPELADEFGYVFFWGPGLKGERAYIHNAGQLTRNEHGHRCEIWQVPEALPSMHVVVTAHNCPFGAIEASCMSDPSNEQSRILVVPEAGGEGLLIALAVGLVLAWWRGYLHV